MLDKETGETSHHIFKEIVDYLNPGDCLVINDTKVIPARLIGAHEEPEPKIEVLLLKRKEKQCVGDAGKTWQESKTRHTDRVRRRSAGW